MKKPRAVGKVGIFDQVKKLLGGGEEAEEPAGVAPSQISLGAPVESLDRILTDEELAKRLPRAQLLLPRHLHLSASYNAGMALAKVLWAQSLIRMYYSCRRYPKRKMYWEAFFLSFLAALSLEKAIFKETDRGVIVPLIHRLTSGGGGV